MPPFRTEDYSGRASMLSPNTMACFADDDADGEKWYVYLVQKQPPPPVETDIRGTYVLLTPREIGRLISWLSDTERLGGVDAGEVTVRRSHNPGDAPITIRSRSPESPAVLARKWNAVTPPPVPPVPGEPDRALQFDEDEDD